MVARSPSWICRRNNFHQRVLWLAYGSLGDLYQNFFLHSLSVLLSIYLGLYFAFWSWLVGLIRPKTFLSSGRNLLVAFLAAAAWATQEWIRGWLFSGFGWNGLGVALHRSWPLIQASEFSRGRWIVLRGCVYERHRGRRPDSFVRGSEKPSDASAFRSHGHNDWTGREFRHASRFWNACRAKTRPRQKSLRVAAVQSQRSAGSEIRSRNSRTPSSKNFRD